MPQFFGIAHNIDRRDAAAVMLERKGVDRTIVLTQHQTGKAVHRRRAGLNGQQSRVLARDAGKEAQNFVGPVDRIESGSALAAAIGIKHGVFGQKLGQRRDIALLGGSGECGSQTRALFARNRKTRTRLLDMRTSARRELPASPFAALQRARPLR